MTDILDWLIELFSKPSPLELSPSDWVAQADLHVITEPAGVMVNLGKLLPGLNQPPKVWVPRIPETGSMLPNFHKEHNNILISGATNNDHTKIVDYLQVGDIAVYRIMENEQDSSDDYSKLAKFYAIHRIIKIAWDNKGKFFEFKGDNNGFKDPYKVRPNEVLWVSTGTIF